MTTDVTRALPAVPQVGFIGGGFMAETHSRAARSARGSLRGVASSSPKSAARAAARLGIPMSYPTVDDLLADEAIDVVHVCTPNTTHVGFALAALDAGKHVVCEKPLATSGPDAEELASRARAAGVTATVPFVYRYHPMVREARARVARGELGELLTIQGGYLQDWLLSKTDDDWRVDAAQGGPSRAFADIGSHLCDLIEFVTGDRIRRLSATKRTFFNERATNRDIATEDAVALLVETAAGAIGTLLVSQVAPGRKNSLTFELSGSSETIRFDQEKPETLWLGRRSGTELLAREPAQLSADAARLAILPAGHPLGYQDAFNAFVADSYAAIAGGSPDGLPTFDDGLRAVQVTEAMLASASSGSWVELGTPAFTAVGGAA
ncbi:MAG: Gfo/Idh/MocA family oxidoreductase [Homoserinimonas sp.]